MLLRKGFAAVLLVLAFSVVPELLRLGAHSLSHHEHAGDADGHHAEWAELAKALAHGHQHTEGEPEHEHNLVPSPPLRPAPPRDVLAPDIAPLAASYVAPLLSGAPPSVPEIRLAAAPPPLLHLHCALLI